MQIPFYRSNLLRKLIQDEYRQHVWLQRQGLHGEFCLLHRTIPISVLSIIYRPEFFIDQFSTVWCSGFIWFVRSIFSATTLARKTHEPSWNRGRLYIFLLLAFPCLFYFTFNLTAGLIQAISLINLQRCLISHQVFCSVSLQVYIVFYIRGFAISIAA